MLDFIFNKLSLQFVIWMVVGLPLVSAIVNSIISAAANGQGTITKRLSAVISFVFSGLTLATAIIITIVLTGFQDTAPAAITGPLFLWFDRGRLLAEVGLQVDEISMCFMLAFAAISFLVRLYSVGYLSNKDRPEKIYTLLDWGIFLALLSTLADNLMLAMVGWILFGWVMFFAILEDGSLSRRKVIGFAILDNISNMAFILAVVLILAASSVGLEDLEHSIFNYETLRLNLESLLTLGTWPLKALLVAALIRFSLFPLFLEGVFVSTTSLPIAAITLSGISSGIALCVMARCNFIFALFPELLSFMVYIGAISIFILSLLSLVELNILRSMGLIIGAQMGFVFLAYGLGEPSLSFFTWFSNLPILFMIVLAIGNIVQATGNADIYKMGGLRYKMQASFWLFLIAALSLAGIYPLGGFFAKSQVLWEAYSRGETIAWLASLIGSAFIAFAIFRLIGRAFFGELTIDDERLKYLGEAPVSQVFTLIVLVLAVVAGGWFNASPIFGGVTYFQDWMSRLFVTEMRYSINGISEGKELILSVITILWLTHAVVMALIIYTQKRDWPQLMARKLKFLHALIANQFYWKEVATTFAVNPLKWVFGSFFKKGVEEKFIYNLFTDGVARSVVAFGRVLGIIDTNRLKYELIYFLIGILIIIAWMLI